MNKGDEIIKGTYGQIVKEVRGRLFLSQEAFAKEIGVCPATLNRRSMEYRDGRILCDCAEERR